MSSKELHRGVALSVTSTLNYGGSMRLPRSTG